jgi:predicted extracellular nuclease/Ca2+-binding RTX toxin-like protein
MFAQIWEIFDMSLVPGSIAIIGMNADNPDNFSFVLLDAVTSGTEISFTDSGWVSSTGTFRGGEGALKWTAASDLAAGTVINSVLDAAQFTVANDAIVGTNGVAFSTDGDQIIAFTGSSTAPTLLYALSIHGNAFSDAVSAQSTALPAGLVLNVSAIARGFGSPVQTGNGSGGEWDNVIYSGPMSGTKAEILAAIGDASNWTGSNSALTQITTNFTVEAGADITAPVLVSSVPADDAGHVGTGGDIVLTMSEPVQKGTGDILIKLAADDSLVQSIDITSGAVAIAGNTVTINPPADLAAGTAYYVEIAPSAIKDLAGNDYAGLSGSSALNFTTAQPGNVIGGIEILEKAASLQGEAGTPDATNAISLVRVGEFAATEGNAEVVSFDPATDQLYILNATGHRIEIVHIGSTGALSKTGEIDLTTLPEFGGANSVAIKNGVVAVAYANATAGENGHVALFNAAGVLQTTVEVGALPDMLTFTPDGSRLLVANEAEPASELNNPAGSISIISVATATIVNTISFASLNGSEGALAAAGLAMYPGWEASADIEPEYITVSPDGTKAYVTLQEVNAVAVIDLADTAADRPVSILPLGMIDRSLVGNEFDGSDRDGAGNDGAINVENHPVLSLLQPDAIASFNAGGKTYFITANEGDARVVVTDEEVRVKDVDLDDAAFPNEAALKSDDEIGRLNMIRHQSDTDGDGDMDQLVTYGGRGISIFQQNEDGSITKVRETGGEFEKILSSLPNASTNFNGENAEDTFDTRSDNKGPEPEGVAVQEINGRLYAFVTLERAGGVMTYDVTDPVNASFVGYTPPLSFSAANTLPADNAPETVITISAADSPMGVPLVVTANEVGNATTVYAAITPIYAIQGIGHQSAFDGQVVTTIGVVIAVDTNGSRGFWIQDANGDGNAASSDGIFVFTNAAPTVQVGQLVSVSGVVDEFIPNGAAAGSLPVTEIVATAASGGAVSVLGTGPEIAATVIGGEGGLLPPSTSFADATAFYESLEGMLVTVKEAVVVGATNDFGEIYAVIDNDADRSNGVGDSDLNDRGALQIEGGSSDFGNTNVTGGDFNPERLQIDDDSGVLAGFASPSVSTGAQLGDVTGVVGYNFGNYEVVATEAFTVDTPSALIKETTALVGSADRLTVASYNAENLDPNDGVARFNVIAQEILNNLKAPDIIALQEVQDNDGPGSAAGSTVKSADVTLQMMVDALNAAAPAGIVYAFVDNPFIGDDTNGGEGGGNIRNAFIYRTDRVDFVDGSLKTIAADGSAITDPAGAGDQQTNPDNPFYDSRLPLVATFEFNGEDVTIVNNHFTSKGGSAALYGSDGTPLNGGEVQRAAQAQAVNNFVDGLLSADSDAKVVVAGDLNDFEFEEPLAVIKGTGSVSNYDVPATDPIAATATYTEGGMQVLHDLLDTLPGDERYDYVFEGNAQTLDHVLVTAGLQNGAQFDVVRINAEFGDQTSDHDPLVASLQIPEESQQNFELQLLHLADGEAGLLADDTAPMLAALVDAFDDDYANTLILSGGDNYIPGPFMNAGTDPSLNAVIGATAPGRADVAIHNALGVEVSAIGNHEWDLGSNVFADSIRASGAWEGAQYALVSANLDFSADSAMRSLADSSLGGTAGNLAGQEASSLKGKVAPWVTVTEGGEKIGILGATTQILERISSPNGTEVNGFPKIGEPGDGTSEVDDMDLLAAQLQPIIDQMIASGINKIILQSHLQSLDNERVLATKLQGVDIILAAGSNTRLGDADDEAVEFPGHGANFADTYPVVTQGTDGKTTLIVNTDNEYTYLGRLVVEFDANGDIVRESLQENMSINGAYASTAENVAEAWAVAVEDLEETAFAEGTKGDEVQDIAEAVDAIIAAKDGNVFGFTDAYLEGERTFVRNQETNFGNLSADANGHAARVALGDEPFIMSLKNGGGIRAQIGAIDVVTGEKIAPIANPDAGKPAGAVSELDVENALRFDNKLMVFDTTPAGLLALLNHGAGLPANNGGFPQIGGVRFSYDPDLPAGSPVQDVALIDEDGGFLRLLVDDGVVVSDAPATLSVVTLNFTANGGDGYPAKTVGENFRFLLQDGTLSAPIDEALNFTAAEVVPANALGEQQAFEEYMQEFHGTPEAAYDVADTPIQLDERIQNLNFRDDTVAEGAPIVGTPDDDDIEGTDEDDTIEAGDGDDRILALAGNDEVLGGNGDDLIDGGEGNDTLFGNAGEDIIEGGDGDDEIDGGEDDDRIYGDDGNDIIAAGNGDDNVKGNAGDDTFIVLDHTNDGADKYDGGAGIDTIDFSASAQAINLTLASATTNFGGDTIVNVENVFGGSDNDVITGNSQANELRGNGGNDELNGGDGDDLLNGGEGDDTLIGGAGIDQLVGGSGGDKIYADAQDTAIDGGEGEDTLYLFANGAATLGATTGIEKLVVQEGNWTLPNGAAIFSDIVLEDGATVTSGVTLDGDDHLTVENGGELISGTAITWAGGGDAVVDNAGLIEGSSRALNTTAGATGSLTFNNAAGGTVNGPITPQGAGHADAVITLNNAGLIQSAASGRAIDFRSFDANGAEVVINNLAGGVIQKSGGDDADVIRPGVNGTVNNWGTITTVPGYVGGGDAIDFQSDAGGKVNNYAGGLIEGSKHAVTGDRTVTVLNQGTMIGRNGSAVNIDNDGTEAEKVFITNHGTMEGRSAELADSDGDAIDVDGLAQILNYGRIAGLGAEGYHDGEPNVSEGIAIGGGTILNYGADAEIYGYGRAIQVDNSSNSNALGKTFINNDGLIKGDGHGPEGVDPADAARFDLRGNEAINLVGDYDDEILNQSTGRIVGGVSMGGGNDRMNNSGSIVATGGSAIDMGAGDDWLWLYAGPNSEVEGTILLGSGNDLVFSTADSDFVIDGGDGNDEMYISGYTGGDDTLSGGGGDDRIYAGLGEDRIDGGADNDSLYGEAGDDLIEGGAGDDIVDGGADDDVIFGGEGTDILIGGLGNDTAKGGADSDTFVIQTTGDGRDSYDGGDGIDTLDYSALSSAVNLTLKDGVATYQTDTIENIENVIGGSAADKLTGNALDNVLTGNAGDDTLKGMDGNDTLDGGEGIDTLDGGAGNDQLFGGANDDVLKGAAGSDTLDGGEGIDALDGGADDDTLLGGAGNDVLKGGAGNDVLKGGVGNDTLTGGAGFDTYAFDSLSDGIDTITDFKVSGSSMDQLQLSASMFQNFAGDDAFDLIGSGFLRAVSCGSETKVQIDLDGGGDAFQTLAILDGTFSNGMLADHTIVVQDPIV